MQGCLFAGDNRNVLGDRPYEFFQPVNVTSELLLCSGKSGQLSIEGFGVGLERFVTGDLPGDRLGCFGAGLLDILAKLVYVIPDGLVIL